MDEWDWHRTIDVNLSGAFFVMQQAGRVMREQGGGVIVNIGANRSHVQAHRAAYLASKEGLLCLTRVAARELAAYNIRVHGVCPGEVNARVVNDWQIQLGSRVFKDAKYPENITELVLYLCSQQAVNSNGVVIDCGNDG
jgi:NAD(P)-dependent dehydrogenase (short-subunit alcohol dehydrogenase family)